MRVKRLVLVILGVWVLLCPAIDTQQRPRRDPQAVYLVSQAVLAMGGAPPDDSLATGTVHIVEGSAEEDGTIRILTRGSDETREEFRTNRGLRGRIYSKGFAAEVSDATIKPASLELAASSQTPCFPLVLLADALNNPDFAFQFVGEGPIGSTRTYHIRFWNTYASHPRLQHLAEFSLKDVWIDAASGLPRKLAYDQREAAGDAPRIAIAGTYSDYRDVGGVLYPFLVERIFNGTPWATIRLSSVLLNVTLSDADFAVQ